MSFPIPISRWLKCDKNEAFVLAIRVSEEGIRDWRVGRNFPRTPQKSRTNPWELTGPSFWTLIAAKDGLFPGSFSRPISGWLKCDKNDAFLFAIRAQKEVARVGGGLVAISPGSPGNRRPTIGN